MRLKLSPLLSLCLVLLAGCPEPSDNNSVVVGARAPAASAKPSATTASSAPPSAAGGIGGGIDTGGAGVPTVRYVTVSPASASLNAPTSSGTTPAGLPSSQTFTAQVILSNGQPDTRGVVWSADPNRLSIDSAGNLRVKPGSSGGSAIVKAMAVGDPTVSTVAAVQVTTDGVLRLAVTGSSSPSDDSAQTSVNIVTQSGAFVKNQPVAIGSSTDIRLPSGSGYQASIQKLAPGSPPSGALLSGLAINPGDVTTATVSLP